jgi:photosynthetic reaction center M subunit
MMEYQNLFTQTQVTGPVSHGVPINAYDMRERTKVFGFSYLMGLIGNAQLGPIYLGRLGLASLMFGLAAFVMIGFNMLAQVDWNPIQFVRQLFWLSLDPPCA